MIANVDASPKEDAASAIDALVRQVSSAVRWEDSVRRLASSGVTAYVEVGPGTVSSGLIRKIHREASVAAMGHPTIWPRSRGDGDGPAKAGTTH